MVCVLCGWWKPPAWLTGLNPAERRPFCQVCEASLRPAGPVRLASGLVVHSLLNHQGPVRNAVHALKYRGVDRVANGLAPFLANLLPDQAAVLVPIPRSLPRRIKFGTDPGRALARAVSRVAGVPVADVLLAPLLHRSQLRERQEGDLLFRAHRAVPAGAVLVDDVLTTGATLSSAAAACQGEVIAAITLTRSVPDGGGDPLTSGYGSPPQRSGDTVHRTNQSPRGGKGKPHRQVLRPAR